MSIFSFIGSIYFSSSFYDKRSTYCTTSIFTDSLLLFNTSTLIFFIEAGVLLIELNLVFLIVLDVADWMYPLLSSCDLIILLSIELKVKLLRLNILEESIFESCPLWLLWSHLLKFADFVSIVNLVLVLSSIVRYFSIRLLISASVFIISSLFCRKYFIFKCNCFFTFFVS